MNRFIKRQFIIMLFIMAVTLTGAFYSSYAFFHQESEGKEQTVVAGNLSISYEGGSIISGDLLPMSDEEGLQTTPYAFEISNTGTLPVDYSVYIHDTKNMDSTISLDHSYIRISIDGNEARYLSDYEQEDMEKAIYRGVLDVPLQNSDIIAQKKHEVRVWIDESAPTDIIGKTVNLQLEVIGIVRES